MTISPDAEVVEALAPFGIRAFTTGRVSGSYGFGTDEPVREVMARWTRLRDELRPARNRLAHANQVHGNRVVVHGAGWEGWLRVDAADGHVVVERGTALVVTIADCVPVFLAHPAGAIGLLHSGWRGTVAGIVDHGIDALARRGFPASELRVHLGPAICGRCYEVSADVATKLTGRRADGAECVDLRAIIADQAQRAGIKLISVSDLCTRCDNARLYSHRAGDTGRQVAAMVAQL